MKQKLIHLLNALNKDYNNQLIQVDVTDYVTKILKNASIITIEGDDCLKAFIAYYKNDIEKNKAFLTMLAVSKDYQHKGYGQKLLEQSIMDLKKLEFKSYILKVLEVNNKAIKLYKKFNFIEKERKGGFIYMKKNI